MAKGHHHSHAPIFSGTSIGHSVPIEETGEWGLERSAGTGSLSANRLLSGG
ncbi:MAG: hypothetical protein GX603_06425 [Chloroflexi bacterium]|nr:hypothetical protein [Chloroflexota bacterium]